MRVAIHRNTDIFDHSTDWGLPWADYCRQHRLPFSFVNGFDADILSTLRSYDCFLWHFSNYALQDMLFARSILRAAKQMGLRVFPSDPTSWHFDDKIAETYCLRSIDAPIPQSWMFYTHSDCTRWVDSHRFSPPIVAKLRTGSGAHNVRLIKSRNEAHHYSKSMFSKGIDPKPSLLYKASSNIRSTRNLQTFINRLRRMPEFLATRSRAGALPREKGYVYFQEFIPNDGYDLKIVVVNNKLSFIARRNRASDFRASGGGDLFFDRSLVSPDIVESAFTTSDKLDFQCMGYDYVVDTRTTTGKIIEISYGFSREAVLQAGGYWDRSAKWHAQPLDVPAEVISSMIL